MNGECCSGMCDPTMHICTVAACAATGSTCVNPTDCCSLNCARRHLQRRWQCVSDNQPCTAGGDACCSHAVRERLVQAAQHHLQDRRQRLQRQRRVLQRQVHRRQTCAAPSTVSYCTQPGDICFHDTECCTGVCTIAAGATAGTCAAITTPCRVDGLTCDGCSGCCSSYCAPFGTGTQQDLPAGVGLPRARRSVHQGHRLLRRRRAERPARLGPGQVRARSGASVDRHLLAWRTRTTARTTSRRARTPASPRATSATSSATAAARRTRSPTTAAARPATRASASSTSSACRAATASRACVMPGGACASSADCCNGLPCVPDGSGHLCAARRAACRRAACAPRPPTAAAATCASSRRARRWAPARPAPPPPATWADVDVLARPARPARRRCRAASTTATASTPGGTCAASDTDCFCQLLIGSPPHAAQHNRGVELAAVEAALHRLFIGVDGTSLRREDLKKARETAALLEQLARIVRPDRLLVDAAAGKAYVGLLAVELLGVTRVHVIEREPRRAELCRQAAARLSRPAEVRVVEEDVARRARGRRRPTSSSGCTRAAPRRTRSSTPRVAVDARYLLRRALLLRGRGRLLAGGRGARRCARRAAPRRGAAALRHVAHRRRAHAAARGRRLGDDGGGAGATDGDAAQPHVARAAHARAQSHARGCATIARATRRRFALASADALAPTHAHARSSPAAAASSNDNGDGGGGTRRSLGERVGRRHGAAVALRPSGRRRQQRSASESSARTRARLHRQRHGEHVQRALQRADAVGVRRLLLLVPVLHDRSAGHLRRQRGLLVQRVEPVRVHPDELRPARRRRA